VLVTALGLLVSGCASAIVPSTITGAPGQVPRPSLNTDFVKRIDGSTATIPLMTAALRLLRGTDDHMKFNTTPAAYDRLIARDANVIFVTAPSKEHLAAAKAAGVQLEVIPVVKDALVFLANKENPITGLTGKQIQDIYTGKVTNWSQLGGADTPIIAYQRQTNSGSQTLFLQLAMKNKKPMEAPGYHKIFTMSSLVDMVSSYDNSKQAIGYSVFYYTDEMYVKDNVKLLPIDGVMPTRESIADGTYPFTTNYFAVLRHDSAADSVSRQLIEWCLSPEAQRLFSATGYVPLDSSHLVPPDSGYGYDGSTLENTTQSSGTGGPVGSKVVQTVGNSQCDDCVKRDLFGNIRVELPGFALAEASANLWLESLPAAKVLEDSYSYVEVVQDLLVIHHHVYGDPFTSHSAVFRLVDGHRMALSDFFYDGVNYIDFINRNLLNEATNSQLRLCPEEYGEMEIICHGWRLAPFTGFPADTAKFSFTDNSVELLFSAGNPFIGHRWGDVTVPLGLPNDLSPYGVGWWRLEKVQVGNYVVEHVVSDYLGVNPHDAFINQVIDDWVMGLDGAGLVVTSWQASPFSPWVIVRQTGSDGGIKQTAAFDWFTGRRVS